MDSISELCERLNDLIDEMIAKGHYQNGEEVVRAIALLLAEREKSLAALRAALDEGEASGPAEPFDFDEFIARKMREHQKVSS